MTNDYQFLFDLKGSSNIQWKTSDCDENSILFYWISEVNSQSTALFESRTKHIKYKYCIVNTDLDSTCEKIVQLDDEDFRSLQSSLLQSFYPLSKKLSFLGVTGTNGKTTTVDLVRQLAIQNNKKVMTFGTLGVYKNDKIIENFNLTTPSIVDIYKTIFTHQQELEIVAFELSSHALAQGRLRGIKFDTIGWTNFTQDHLDYHKTMDEYFNAKRLIFKKLNKDGEVFLTNDLSEYFQKMDAPFKKSSVYASGANPFFKIKFNQSNLGLAMEMLNYLNSDFHYDADELIPPAGRFEIVEYKQSYIIIDYAHTPDALLAICSEVSQTFKEHDLITLFGCGGDRDKSKRALMGNAASKFSKMIIITNDNPRTEDPLLIAKEVTDGVSVPCEIELDRKKAISLGVDKLVKHILIIAGKGHEDYMDIGGKKKYFSDRETVEEILRDRTK